MVENNFSGLLDIIRENVGRKKSQDYRKKHGVDLSYVTHSLTLNYVLERTQKTFRL